MEADIIGKPLVFPSEERRDEDEVSGAGDGQEFGEALDEPKENGANEVHVGTFRRVGLRGNREGLGLVQSTLAILV